MGFKVMSIYPTTRETRLAVYDGEREVRRAEAGLGSGEIHSARSGAEQFHARLASVERELGEWLAGCGRLDAVASCGLLPWGRRAGLYAADDEFMRQMKVTETAGHLVNQGALLASHISRAWPVKMFALVPFSVDEVDAVYRISGVPGMHFGRLTHAIQIKSALRRAAADMGRSPDEISAVVAHLGNVFSICSHSEGRIRDFTNQFERGPFSVSHSGGIPATELVRMAYSGMWSKLDLINMLNGEGGAASYIGASGADEMISRAEEGDAYASLVMNAMLYQIASEIGAQAAVLGGKVDAIVLSGGVAAHKYFTAALRDRVSWISGRVMVYDETDELRDIAMAALSALRGEVNPSICPIAPRGAVQ
jgi:butyrate kinase